MLRLLGDIVLIRRVRPIERTRGGIRIAPTHSDAWQYPEGTVLLCGPEAARWIKPGDHVLWGREKGVREVLLGGEPLLLLRAAEIDGVFEAA